MPTVRGWAALGAALGFVIAWISFGERLLLAAAAFLAIAVGYGVLSVRRSSIGVTIDRQVLPLQVFDGDHAVVTVTLHVARDLSVVTVADTVTGLGTAEFAADRATPDDPLIGRYEVVCHPRGVYQVGPTDVRVRDPFGMAESAVQAGSVDRLVVYPRYEELEGLPVVRGQDPNVATARTRFSQTGGEDFFTLRDYEDGDDLRKVHWPSSAKRDRLMIRQLEMPWQSRALIVLDTDVANYPNPDTFEHAVKGAASVVHHFYRSGFSPTLSTGRPEAVTVATAERHELAMQELAMVATTEGADLRRALGRLRQRGIAGGALVLVTGSPCDSHLALYRTLGNDYTRTLVMAVTDRTNEALGIFRRGGVLTVVTGRNGRWSDAWRDAMESSWATAIRR
ncbi:MAG TPA: DUF58 domain-containing protein [Acidimicrobiia bacterium]